MYTRAIKQHKITTTAHFFCSSSVCRKFRKRKTKLYLAGCANGIAQRRTFPILWAWLATESRQFRQTREGNRVGRNFAGGAGTREWILHYPFTKLPPEPRTNRVYTSRQTVEQKLVVRNCESGQWKLRRWSFDSEKKSVWYIQEKKEPS
jgi:hypothetical protein